tara:strand:- start:2507 stop:3913 length:1407 start_codon:yes stop_codon:yes gene_type:complete
MNVLIQEIFDQVGFTPTPAQVPFLEAPEHYIQLTGGMQGGKSKSAAAKAMALYPSILAANPLDGDGKGPPILIWLIGEAYEETAKEFEYIGEHLASLFGAAIVGPGTSKRLDPGHIEVKYADEAKARIRVETKSAAKVSRLSKDAPHLIIMCEAGQQPYDVLETAEARVNMKGGWLILVGTLEAEQPWYAQNHIAWQHGVDGRRSFSLPSHTNHHFYPEGKNDPKILDLKRNRSDRFFMERIEGVPVPPTGLVFPEFRPDIHIRDVDWLPDEEIFLFTDPGYGSAAAVEVYHDLNGQMTGFDEVYEQGMTTEEIIEICQQRPWWKAVSDGRAHGVIDIAGYQHQAMSAPAEIWLKRAGLYLHAKKVGINDGVERMRAHLKPDPIFGRPKITFSPRQKGILSEFGAATSPFDSRVMAPYRNKLDRDGNMVGKTPEQKNNHGISATIYGLVDRYGYTMDRRREKIPVLRF